MAKGKRKPSFSDSEIRCLIENFEVKKDVLLSKFNSSNTNARKKKIWSDITTAVNARATNVSRTVEEIRKKWKDLLATAKKDASVEKHPPTGGGPIC